VGKRDFSLSHLTRSKGWQFLGKWSANGAWGKAKGGVWLQMEVKGSGKMSKDQPSKRSTRVGGGFMQKGGFWPPFYRRKGGRG